MERRRRLTDREVTELEERMVRAIETFHDFFGAIRDEPELTEKLRARAAEGMRSRADVRRDWPRIADDWRQLREQIGELRQELGRIGREVGEMWRSMEEEEEWPTGA